jgi:hypothetical protein
MNKFFTSVGLIAAGTVGLQAAYAPGLNSMETSKMWSVQGSLRGFYDSNYQTASSNARGSIGFEASPEVDLNVALQQTELGLRYTYGMYYYQDRQNLGQNPIDQTHQFDLWVDHAFSERWQTKVMDTFVIGQEPELIDPNTSVPTRTDGNNLRNTGTVDLNTTWTRLFSTKLAYENTYFDYQNSGTTINNFATDGPSLAGQLNRINQTISLDLQWAVAPETIAFVGGAFSWVNYTGDEPIAFTGTSYLYSDTRNSRSYFGYVGAQHNMLANLSFTGKAGVQYTDNYNQPGGATSVNPYADLSLVYTYLPGSYAQAGFTQTENASDQVGYQNGKVTLFTESSTIYASVNQKLTPKVMGSVLGRWQHSIYNGGLWNNQAQDYYSLGAALSYAFNPHFSAEAGYNLDYLQSNIPGNQYSRNRVYVGVSAAY